MFLDVNLEVKKNQLDVYKGKSTELVRIDFNTVCLSLTVDEAYDLACRIMKLCRNETSDAKT